MNSSCVLLNGDYTFLCLLDWKKAMKLVFAGKVTILKYSDKLIRSVSGVFRMPTVLVLMKMVRSVYKRRVPFSKKNLLLRDRSACAYCGKSGKTLTIDHVIPKSKGGKTNFDNCVVCCQGCNHRKGSGTPRQAGMRLIKRPYQPMISEFVRIRLEQSGVYDLLADIGIC